MRKKITTKEFIAICNKIHNFKYIYDKTVYKDAKSPVTITCPVEGHGDFEQISSYHKSGNGCQKCSKNIKMTKEEFEIRAQKIHNNKYTYINTKFPNTKVIITCRTHGDFYINWQSHLKGYGCKSCSKELKYSNTHPKLLKKLSDIHKNKYNYSLIHTTAKLKDIVTIICPVHGEFKKRIQNHIDGQGCEKCSTNRIKTTEDFIKKARQVHGNLYDYSQSNYKGTKVEVKIICNIHGVFEQAPNNHVSSGQKCPKCMKEITSVYSQSLFKAACIRNNIGLGVFYILRCFDQHEEFYKLGITSRSIAKRYKGSDRLPYNYEIVQEIYDLPEIIFKLEKQLKCYLLNFDMQYTPNIFFKGSKTECFKVCKNI